MNSNLIFQLVEVAISLAQTQLDGDQAAKTLLAIVQKGVQAFEQHTGERLDPALIKAEEPI
jgi:hypothetical protein